MIVQLYPVASPSFTVSNGEERAGHWREDFIAHIGALGLDLNYLTPRSHILLDSDSLVVCPRPK